MLLTSSFSNRLGNRRFGGGFLKLKFQLNIYMETTKTFKFSNGDKVKEKITGFTGIITGTCFYLTGCDQYLVIPKSKEPNVKSEGAWYDEGRLELIEENVLAKDDVKADKGNGADIAAPNKG